MSNKFTISWIILAGGVIVQSILLISLAVTDGQTIDEATHLSSGASYLTTGDFKLNPEHPPLVKLLSGSSALLASPQVPTDDPSWNSGNQWDFGRAFLYHNTVSADTLLFLGRLPTILLTVILTIAVVLITRVLLGPTASMVSLILVTLEPTILAHGHYVTTDVPFTLFFFLSIAYFWWAFQTRSLLAAVMTGIWIALAHVTKFSAVTLWPILIVTGGVFVLSAENMRTALRVLARIMGISIGITVLAVLLVYGFTTRTAYSDPTVRGFYADPETQASSIPFGSLLADTSGIGGILRWGAEAVPIPAFDYFRGLADVAVHNYNGHTSYLLGEQRTKGWWYYFPVALFAKLPAALFTLSIIGLFLGLRLLMRQERQVPRDIAQSFLEHTRARIRRVPLTVFAFGIPPLLYLLMSLGSHINLGVRHVLPVVPFLIILGSLPFSVRPQTYAKIYQAAVSGMLLLFVIGVGIQAPYFTSYFSEFVGGWKQGPTYLLDSNFDWGQDTARLKHALATEHFPEPIAFSYFGSVDIPAYMQRGFSRVPTDGDVQTEGIPTGGTIIISAGNYFSFDSPYQWLRKQPITQIVGTTLYVFVFGRTIERNE